MGLYLILKWLFETIVFILAVLTIGMILIVVHIPIILYFLVLGPRGIEIYMGMTSPFFEKVIQLGDKVLHLIGRYEE